MNWRTYVYTGLIVFGAALAVMSLPEPWESAMALGGAAVVWLWLHDMMKDRE